VTWITSRITKRWRRPAGYGVVVFRVPRRWMALWQMLQFPDRTRRRMARAARRA
jgi:hypothetical protein